MRGFRSRVEKPVDELRLRSLRQIHPDPGDDILVHLAEPLTFEQTERIREQFIGLFPDNRVLFIEAGVEVDVVASASYGGSI